MSVNIFYEDDVLDQISYLVDLWLNYKIPYKMLSIALDADEKIYHWGISHGLTNEWFISTDTMIACGVNGRVIFKLKAKKLRKWFAPVAQ